MCPFGELTPPDEQQPQATEYVHVMWSHHIASLVEPFPLQVWLSLSPVSASAKEKPVSPDWSLFGFVCRDAISKALYSRLFSWLVQRVNAVVRGRERDARTTSIALLDIFGFEVGADSEVRVNI